MNTPKNRRQALGPHARVPRQGASPPPSASQPSADSCSGIEVRDAALPVMCASMPFWLAGFWRPHHLKFEKFVPLWLDFRLEDQRILYRSTPALEGAQASPAPGRRRARQTQGEEEGGGTACSG